MSMSLKTSLAALALSFAVAGVSMSAFAGNYRPGIDRHNPPGTQSQGQTLLPRLTPPSNVDVTPTGSINPPTVLKERYKGGDHDYYRGIIPPAF